MSPIDQVQSPANIPTEMAIPPRIPHTDTFDSLDLIPKTNFGSSKIYQDISIKLQMLHQHLEIRLSYLQNNLLSAVATKRYLLKIQGQLDPIISQCQQLKTALIDPRHDVNGHFREDVLELIGGPNCVIAKEWQKLLMEWRESQFDAVIEDERIWVIEKPVVRVMQIVEYWVASLINPMVDKKDNVEAEEDGLDLGLVANALLFELEDWEEAIKGG